MKSMIRYIAVVLLLFCILPLEALGKELIPVGKVIGLELRSGSVTIAAFDEELGAAAQAAGLQAGDVIVQIDDVAVASSDDVRRALARSHGAVRMTVSRGGQQQELTLTPQITRDGPKLGAYLKQGVTGIGTVTWYDPDSGDFATLGHGVNNVNGKLLSMTEGFAYDARVLSVRQGKPGDPGQLMGAVERLEPVGTLRANTAQGVFGKCTRGWNGENSVYGFRNRGSGIFCGNFKDLSESQTHGKESADQGDRSRIAGCHRRYRAGNVRQPHYPGRQAGGRRDSRPGE